MGAGSTGLPPGFAVPVHRALTEHILLGGAPRGLAIANATLAGAIGLGLQLWMSPGGTCASPRICRSEPC